MKIYSDAALEALASGDNIVAGGFELFPSGMDPFRAWGGDGELELDGNAFTGLGAHTLVSVSGGTLGGAAQNVTIALSGIDTTVAALVDSAAVRGAPAVVWRMIFNGAGTELLDAKVYTRGRADRMPRRDKAGGTSTLSLMIEGAAMGLGRRGERMRSDADQRLVSPSDGGLRHVSFAAEKTLYWGGTRPARAASTFGGGGYSYTDFGGGGLPF